MMMSEDKISENSGEIKSRIKITLLTDNPDSWIISHMKSFLELLKKKYDVKWIFSSKDLEKGDIAIFLSCERLISSKLLSLNKHNLVVHSSELPKGKGFSPLSWQILEGKNEYVNTLFEAADAVDSGVIYYTDVVKFEGHELIDEIRKKDFDSTVKLIIKFLEDYPTVKGKKQAGEESFYRKRKPEDSEIDINKTIKEQFNLFRISDNQRYPAFFRCAGQKYVLKINKENSTKN